MGALTDHVADPDQTLDLPGMTDEQLFETMRNLVRFGQVEHYRPSHKPASFLEIVGILALFLAASFFAAAAFQGPWLMGLFFN